jgi:hypothetical protein
MANLSRDTLSLSLNSFVNPVRGELRTASEPCGCAPALPEPDRMALDFLWEVRNPPL